MSEKPPQPNEVPSSEVPEEIVLTPEERAAAEEYAHTGNPEHLTPRIALALGVGPDVMREVVGATGADVKKAENVFQEQEEQVREQIDGLLRLFEADTESLEQKSIPEQLTTLLDGATVHRGDIPSNDNLDVETIRDEALKKISSLLLHDQTNVYILFEVIRLNAPQGTRDIQAIGEVVDYLLIAHAKRNPGATAALNTFLEIADTVLNAEFEPNTNYLGAELLSQLLRSVSGREPIKAEADQYVPFEITKGVYAVFSHNMDRIFVADNDTSKKVRTAIESGWTPEYSTDQGHDIPAYEYEYVSEDLFDLTNEIIDSGTSLDKIAAQAGITDPVLVKDFTTVLDSSVRQIIEEKFAIRLAELSIREQLYFLNYLKNITVEEAERAQEFTSTYGAPGMRTFLALEELGTDYGDEIIKYGVSQIELGDENQANIVFGHFSKLQKAADQTEAYLVEAFKQSPEEIGVVQEVSKKIRLRAARFLSELLQQPLGNTWESFDRITDAVEAASTEATLFTAAFRTLKERGELDLEEIQDTAFRSEDPSDLTEEDKTKMQEILRRNWADESEAFLHAIQTKLEEAFSSTKSKFYVLRHQGEIVGFNRFDDNTDDPERPHIYFGSFNTDPHYSRGKLGEAIYEESLKRELTAGHIVEADCDPNAPITKKYIESGFVATAFHLYGDKPSWHIVHPNLETEYFKSRQLSSAQLLEYAENNQPADIVIRERSNNDAYPELANSNRVLTRILSSEDQDYLVFETVPEVLQAHIKPPPRS